MARPKKTLTAGEIRSAKAGLSKQLKEHNKLFKQHADGVTTAKTKAEDAKIKAKKVYDAAVKKAAAAQTKAIKAAEKTQATTVAFHTKRRDAANVGITKLTAKLKELEDKSAAAPAAPAVVPAVAIKRAPKAKTNGAAAPVH